MSKKIAFINSSITWGGGEKWHLENAEALVKQGFAVTLICHPDSILRIKCIEEGLSFIAFGTSKFSFLFPSKIQKARKILKGFDTAILNLPSDLKLFGIASKGDCKLIYRRGSAIPIRNNSLNRKLLNNKVDLIIANSKATKNTILENGVLANENKIRIIYNGIKIQQEPNFKSKNEFFTIGHLGRFVEQKNQIALIEIAKILNEKGVNFLIKIGGSGKLEQDLKYKTKQLGLEDNIQFLGEIKDLDTFYNSIDLFALTSKWEGFGYVIAESFSYGKPVIAFEISSNPEMVINRKTGFLIPAFDLQKFADKIIELKEKPNLLLEMGKFGFNFIKEERSFEKSVSNLISAI